MWALAKVNGLWEAIVSLSDAILIDSPTATSLPTLAFFPSTPPSASIQLPRLKDASDFPLWSEHDVDSALHTLFSNAAGDCVFEAMCNPPGGDWSGVSFQAALNTDVARWTSLPRVTAEDAKRPDHVVIFQGPPLVVLSIESKELPGSVEAGIGPRLVNYMSALYAVPPNIVRGVAERAWRPYAGRTPAAGVRFVSGAAAIYTTLSDMQAVLARGQVDLVLALQFLPGEERTLLHLLCRPVLAWLPSKLRELAKRFAGRLEVQVH